MKRDTLAEFLQSMKRRWKIVSGGGGAVEFVKYLDAYISLKDEPKFGTPVVKLPDEISILELESDGMVSKNGMKQQRMGCDNKRDQKTSQEKGNSCSIDNKSHEWWPFGDTQDYFESNKLMELRNLSIEAINCLLKNEKKNILEWWQKIHWSCSVTICYIHKLRSDRNLWNTSKQWMTTVQMVAIIKMKVVANMKTTKKTMEKREWHNIEHIKILWSRENNKIFEDFVISLILISLFWLPFITSIAFHCLSVF